MSTGAAHTFERAAMVDAPLWQIIEAAALVLDDGRLGRAWPVPDGGLQFVHPCGPVADHVGWVETAREAARSIVVVRQQLTLPSPLPGRLLTPLLDHQEALGQWLLERIGDRLRVLRSPTAARHLDVTVDLDVPVGDVWQRLAGPLACDASPATGRFSRRDAGAEFDLWLRPRGGGSRLTLHVAGAGTAGRVANGAGAAGRELAQAAGADLLAARSVSECPLLAPPSLASACGGVVATIQTHGEPRAIQRSAWLGGLG